MALLWNEYKGHIGILISTLRRALGQYARYYSGYKIGLTVDPEQRWRRHLQDGCWNDMVVIYSTASENYAAEAEFLLIEHGWEADYMPECWNIVRGGGGLRPGHSRYYIYILLAN